MPPFKSQRTLKERGIPEFHDLDEKKFKQWASTVPSGNNHEIDVCVRYLKIGHVPEEIPETFCNNPKLSVCVINQTGVHWVVENIADEFTLNPKGLDYLTYMVDDHKFFKYGPATPKGWEGLSKDVWKKPEITRKGRVHSYYFPDLAKPLEG